MEKAIIIFCLVLGVSCSGLEEKKTSGKSKEKVETAENKKPEGFCAHMPSEGLGTFIPVKTVQWMYMDDSIKNICRALNFRLPYMASDIKTIPEMITPEILSLSPVRTFEVIAKSKINLNDSITFFKYTLKKENCECAVVRIYKGNVASRAFDGFAITEQIVCNAMDEMIGQSIDKNSEKADKKEVESDSTHYEVHGHDH